VAYGLLLRGLWQDVDATIHSVAETLARTTGRSAPGVFPPGMDELLGSLLGPTFPDRFYQFLDPSGRLDPRWPHLRRESLRASSNALENAARGIATFETVPSGRPYPTRLVTFPVVVLGQVARIIQVGMSLEGLYAAERRYLWSIAALLPLALVLAGGGGWLLARRALRPVDHMAATARRIGAEDLTRRLEGAEVEDELGRLARTLNEMLARLEAAFAQVRRFSADASHELRTPLTVLRGEIEVALRAPRDAEEYRRVLAGVLEEVESMARLVDDLLLLSRADAGALRWDLGPVELDRLVEEAAREGEVLGRGVGVQVKIDRLEPLMVTGDDQRLKQLLRNLVDNGVKYTPPGGRVTLALQARSLSAEQSSRQFGETAGGAGQSTDQPHDRSPGWAEIVVRDTGIGIPAEALPRIFERFYRVDSSRSRETGGAGLGLCIAKTIAEAHGGTIQVQSTPGSGSTFTVILPLSG